MQDDNSKKTAAQYPCRHHTNSHWQQQQRHLPSKPYSTQFYVCLCYQAGKVEVDVGQRQPVFHPKSWHSFSRLLTQQILFRSHHHERHRTWITMPCRKVREGMVGGGGKICWAWGCVLGWSEMGRST